MQSKNIINVAAAGAGKTYNICHEALVQSEDREIHQKILILSYTNRGVDSIVSEIRKQNMGVLSPKIDVMTWFRFLLNEMIKPYQTTIFYINEVKSIDFSDAYGKINYKKSGTRERYMNVNRDIRSKEAAALVLYMNQKNGGKIIKRLSDIYTQIYIDEVQDMAGYDLNLIELLMKSDIAITCVGDNKQATFKTNNSVKNKKVSGKNIWAFFQKLIDSKSAEMRRNLVSRRFNQEICDFANNVYPNENNISTLMKEVTDHDGVFLIQKQDVQAYFEYYKPTVLKYNSKTDTDGYISFNFGECKGMTFERVLIYPNGPFRDFILNGKALKSPQKYYVAVTRAKYSIAIVLDKLPNKCVHFQRVNISIKNRKINVMRYSEGGDGECI
ncbi:MAG: AAA family ATPase [Clostridiales bacterium]|nr:AAA family ATPase [Clostridiales bacterium]